MIPLAVTAKNEQHCITACLESLIKAVRHVEAQRETRFDVIVVTDDCEDNTGAIAQTFDRVRVMESSGGIAAAQRLVVETVPADFIIFCDADIYVQPEALLSVVDAMTADSDLRVAYPLKKPLPPQQSSILAKALYTYNRFNGFQTKRHYFNGRFFAIRGWDIPGPASFASRTAQLPRSKFYNYSEGIRVDDIYLSRIILQRHGRKAIAEVTGGTIFYRPPETYTGMYRTYRRMRMEIERLDRLLPDTIPVHKADGIRGYDRRALADASFRDKAYWYWFRIVLQLCKCHYLLERFWYHMFSRKECPPWERVEESKTPISIG